MVNVYVCLSMQVYTTGLITIPWWQYIVWQACTPPRGTCTLYPELCTLPFPSPPGEVQDLSKQLDQGGLSTHELEKVKRKLEAEIDELTQQLQVCVWVCQLQ